MLKTALEQPFFFYSLTECLFPFKTSSKSGKHTAVPYFCKIFERKAQENTATNLAVPDFCTIFEQKTLEYTATNLAAPDFCKIFHPKETQARKNPRKVLDTQ